MIGDKIVKKPIKAKGAGDGLRGQPRSVGSAGASRNAVPVEEVPEVECKDADMKAGIAMDGVSIGEFVYFLLHCCDWMFDNSAGTVVPLETLPNKEIKYGVGTWIKNEKGLNVFYPSTNKLEQMPGLYTTKGINGDNFQLKYTVKTTLSGEDKQLAEKMKTKNPYYNYALIPLQMYLKILSELGDVFNNNKRDDFFWNEVDDTFKFFVGTTKDLREAKDWDYAKSEFLGTVRLQVEESKSATIGVDGNINVTTTLKQAEHKGSSAGLTEYQDKCDRIPMLGSSVVVMKICLNKDRVVGTQSIPQDATCYLCGEYSAINLTRDDEVYAGCGHTSLCPNCVSNWNEKCFDAGTCPTCRYAWNTIVIANNKMDWEANKAELPADATDQVYDPERAKEREQHHLMLKINRESDNMFVSRKTGWNILFEMRQHDGKDDDTGVEVFPKPKSRTGDSLTYEADAGQHLKVYIQNKSNDALKFRPVYRPSVGDEEPEDLQDLKFDEQYELPYPLQKDAGEAPDAWLLKDSDDNTVLTLNFTVKT